MVKKTLQIIGANAASSFLLATNPAVRGAIASSMRQVGPFLVGEVKSSIAGKRAEPASVDTGRFLNSIDFQVDDLSVAVFTKLTYPEFLERGTSRIAARPHFGNTKERNRDRVVEFVEDEVKKVL